MTTSSSTTAMHDSYHSNKEDTDSSSRDDKSNAVAHFFSKPTFLSELSKRLDWRGRFAMHQVSRAMYTHFAPGVHLLRFEREEREESSRNDVSYPSKYNNSPYQNSYTISRYGSRPRCQERDEDDECRNFCVCKDDSFDYDSDEEAEYEKKSDGWYWYMNWLTYKFEEHCLEDARLKELSATTDSNSNVPLTDASAVVPVGRSYLEYAKAHHYPYVDAVKLDAVCAYEDVSPLRMLAPHLRDVVRVNLLKQRQLLDIPAINALLGQPTVTNPAPQPVAVKELCIYWSSMQLLGHMEVYKQLEHLTVVLDGDVHQNVLLTADTELVFPQLRELVIQIRDIGDTSSKLAWSLPSLEHLSIIQESYCEIDMTPDRTFFASHLVEANLKRLKRFTARVKTDHAWSKNYLFDAALAQLLRQLPLHMDELYSDVACEQSFLHLMNNMRTTSTNQLTLLGQTKKPFRLQLRVSHLYALEWLTVLEGVQCVDQVTMVGGYYLQESGAEDFKRKFSANTRFNSPVLLKDVEKKF